VCLFDDVSVPVINKSKSVHLKMTRMELFVTLIHTYCDVFNACTLSGLSHVPFSFYYLFIFILLKVCFLYVLHF